ncbi:hypothetical protein [Desulfofalx alkaliphila]|uniref:hypothetical protein n=1 Tax=Desulfofalx alkaliphila TaxID=105483 RepID=UPI0004E26638|nr:hypothetical protein [Desulfofalx alkaliphila]
MSRYTSKDIQKIDELIQREYGKKTAYTVACLAGSKYSAYLVRTRAHKMGFKALKKNVEWSSQDIEYITKNHRKHSMMHMANYLDVEIGSIKSLLLSLGLEVKKEVASGKERRSLRMALGGAVDEIDYLLGSRWDFR